MAQRNSDHLFAVVMRPLFICFPFFFFFSRVSPGAFIKLGAFGPGCFFSRVTFCAGPLSLGPHLLFIFPLPHHLGSFYFLSSSLSILGFFFSPLPLLFVSFPSLFGPRLCFAKKKGGEGVAFMLFIYGKMAGSIASCKRSNRGKKIHKNKTKKKRGGSSVYGPG